jgi:4-hydroxythreonine-4-phosphate dehydrogenase
VIVLAERAALEAVRDAVRPAVWRRLEFVRDVPGREALAESKRILVWDPVGRPRTVRPGSSAAADAAGALAALDAGIALARGDTVDALVTAPVSKASIALNVLPGFTGHTDYLAAACGLRHYGRDYLMAFLAPGLRVALLTVHVPLAQAIAAVTTEAIVDALACLSRHAHGPIAVAGLNPHAGEEGLLGREDAAIVAPAVARARALGIDAHGPESADSLFARASRGEFAWVLALYHDQGLVAVKTASFGLATNWTVGLPFLRTSVDHGTAFALAGRNRADERPLLAVIETTLRLLEGKDPAVRSE